VINVDNIAVDLDDEDLEQMQRIISQHEMETFLNAKKIQRSDQAKLEQYITDSPEGTGSMPGGLGSGSNE